VQHFYRGKSRPTFWATSVIFKKLPKVHKQSPNKRKIEKSGHPDAQFSFGRKEGNALLNLSQCCKKHPHPLIYVKNRFWFQKSIHR
jgi:hypothetical protein